MKAQEILVKGALLHDIWRLCSGLEANSQDHFLEGRKFLQKYASVDDASASKQLLNCMKCHSAKDFSFNEVTMDDPAYLVAEAAEIAMADQNTIVTGENCSFSTRKALESIFNNFGGVSSDVGRYKPIELNPRNKFSYPVRDEIGVSTTDYQVLLKKFENSLKQEKLDKISCNSLLRICEDTMSYIPFVRGNSEGNDISLFIHSKMTAAIANCLKLYLDEQKVNNYKEVYLAKNKNWRCQTSYMLISGDISGIQDFIYTIPSQGALKSLRGRSFYLEIMLENFIDELLECLELTRANLLYSGGGHFYVLAPATFKAQQAAAEIRKKCNQWLLSTFGTKLYLALAYATCTAENLMEFKRQRSVFATVSKELNKDKLNRYDEETLAHLFTSDKETEDGRECGVCHTTSKRLFIYDNANICPVCQALFKLGAKILDEDVVFVVSNQADETAMPVFGLEGKYWLYAVASEDLNRFSKNIIRLYVKNENIVSDVDYIRVWIADMSAHDKLGNIMTFEELAESCCNGKQGIKRLGVLRADVDNLGAAFISGFINPDHNDAFKYATLTRYAELSKSMSRFFKLAVNKISDGEVVAVGDRRFEPFNIYGLNKDYHRKVHIVYSGGDDMFIVGAWDELLELAIDVRRAFEVFTGGKLSFSAGLALFNPKFPISKMAELAGNLEDAAKKMPNKDSIALFGMETQVEGEQYELQCKHIYKWEEMVNGVCKDKLKYLLTKLSFDGWSEGKISVGKTMLYKLMNLVDACGEEKINLARFAYTLARLEPRDRKLIPTYNDFSQKMYCWIKNDKDRKELYTAINLLVYYLRED